jgi:hypothetical protein
MAETTIKQGNYFYQLSQGVVDGGWLYLSTTKTEANFVYYSNRKI